MPLRDWLFRINDIVDAVSAVRKYVDGMTYEEFVADRKTVDAVVRNLIIIGEAAVHIPEEICQSYQTMPWPDMRARRNFVVHEFSVSATRSSGIPFRLTFPLFCRF